MKHKFNYLTRMLNGGSTVVDTPVTGLLSPRPSGRGWGKASLLLFALFLLTPSNMWAGKGFYTDGQWNAMYWDGNDSYWTMEQKDGSTVNLGVRTTLYLKEGWVQTWTTDNWKTSKVDWYVGYNNSYDWWGKAEYNDGHYSNFKWDINPDDYDMIWHAPNNPGENTLFMYWRLDDYVSTSASYINFTIPGFKQTSVSQTDFAAGVNGNQSKTISFTQHYGNTLNTGNCSLSGNNSSEFSVTGISETGVTVKFAPTSAGSKSATLTITDAHGKTCTITLQGTVAVNPYTGDLYIVGSCTNAGWTANPTDDYKLTGDGQGHYTWTGTLKTASNWDAGFKFLKGKDWCSYGSYGSKDNLTESHNPDNYDDVRYRNHIDPNNKGTYNLQRRTECQGNDQTFLVTANSGVYTLTLDLTDQDNGTMTITKKYYIKHPWGTSSDWSWKELTSNGDGTYSVEAQYGNAGCNWNTKEDDSGSSWVESPTLVGSPATGDECTFTLNPTAGTITITKNGSPTPTAYYIGGRLGFSKDEWGTNHPLTYDDASGYYKYETGKTVAELSAQLDNATQYFIIHTGGGSSGVWYSATKSECADFETKKGESNAYSMIKRENTTQDESRRFIFSDTGDNSGPVTIWFNAKSDTKKVWYTAPAAPTPTESTTIYMLSHYASTGGGDACYVNIHAYEQNNFSMQRVSAFYNGEDYHMEKLGDIYINNKQYYLYKSEFTGKAKLRVFGRSNDGADGKYKSDKKLLGALFGDNTSSYTTTSYYFDEGKDRDAGSVDGNANVKESPYAPLSASAATTTFAQGTLDLTSIITTTGTLKNSGAELYYYINGNKVDHPDSWNPTQGTYSVTVKYRGGINETTDPITLTITAPSCSLSANFDIVGQFNKGQGSPWEGNATNAGSNPGQGGYFANDHRTITLTAPNADSYNWICESNTHNYTITNDDWQGTKTSQVATVKVGLPGAYTFHCVATCNGEYTSKSITVTVPYPEIGVSGPFINGGDNWDHLAAGGDNKMTQNGLTWSKTYTVQESGKNFCILQRYKFGSTDNYGWDGGKESEGWRGNKVNHGINNDLTGLNGGNKSDFSSKIDGLQNGNQVTITVEMTDYNTYNIRMEEVVYSITYDCDGAESGCPENVASATNLPNPLPAALVKSGYTFDGWFTNAEKTVEAVAGAALTANTTLYAKWSVTEYYVAGNDEIFGKWDAKGVKLETYSEGVYSHTFTNAQPRENDDFFAIKLTNGKWASAIGGREFDWKNIDESSCQYMKALQEGSDGSIWFKIHHQGDMTIYFNPTTKKIWIVGPVVCETSTKYAYTIASKSNVSTTSTGVTGGTIAISNLSQGGGGGYDIVQIEFNNDYYACAKSDGTTEVVQNATSDYSKWYKVPANETYKPGWTSNTYDVYYFQNVATNKYLGRGFGDNGSPYNHNGQWLFYVTTLQDNKENNGKWFLDTSDNNHLVARDGVGSTLKQSYMLHNFNKQEKDCFTPEGDFSKLICSWAPDPTGNVWTRASIEKVGTGGGKTTPVTVNGNDYYRMTSSTAITATLNKALEEGDKVKLYLHATANTTVTLKKGDTQLAEFTMNNETAVKEYAVTSSDAGQNVLKVSANNDDALIYKIEVVSKLDPELEWDTDLSGGVELDINGTATHTASSSSTGAISYSSSNTGVATVNASGLVTAQAVGTTTITATQAADGCYGKATVTYTVTVSSAQLTLDAPAKVAPSAQVTVTPTNLADFPTDIMICYTLYEGSVADANKVDVDFTITKSGDNKGQATFTAPAKTGTYIVKADVHRGNDCSAETILSSAQATVTVKPLTNTFTNEGGDNLWSNTANWSEEMLPDAETKVTIRAKAIVNIKDAAAKSVIIDDAAGHDAEIEILSTGGLQVVGTITRTTDGNTYGPTTIHDIYIHSDVTGTGALVFDNSNNCQAYVEMYSKANIVDKTKNWQYMGTPFSDVTNVANNYYGSYLYFWNTAEQKWKTVKNGTSMSAFAGYCISQENKTTYVMSGTLVSTANKEIILGEGNNVIGNSWTAPINVNQFTNDDFKGDITKTIYMFNTGVDATKNYNEGDAPGTYIAIPINMAGYVKELKVIPAMAGYFVVSNEGTGTLTLNYDRLTRTTPLSNEPMRAPNRANREVKPDIMSIKVTGESFSDKLYLAEREDFAEEFDNGWDAEKWPNDAYAPELYASTTAGDQAVSALPELEGTLLGFRAGGENAYTISFQYDGDKTYYLNDLIEQKSTIIRNDQTYFFLVGGNDITHRFQISTTPFKSYIGTGADNIGDGVQKAVKFIENDKLFILRNGRLYDGTGKALKPGK